MKKITGLVVILAILILGSYYGMGILTEQSLKKDISILNQTNGLYVDIQRYDRGWFTSTVQMQWRMHVPERVVKGNNNQSTLVPAKDYAMEMPLTVYHGPVMFSESGVHFGLGYAHTTLELPKQYDQEFSQNFTTTSTKPNLELSVFVNYLNRSKLQVQLPAFTLIAKNNKGKFEWLGMTSTTGVSSHLDKIYGDFSITGMNFIKDNTHAAIGAISAEYNLYEALGMYLGNASFTFDSMVVKNNEQKLMSLKSLSMDTGSDVNDDLFSSYANISLESLYSQGKNYGPFTLKLSIKNLDAQVIADINSKLNQTSNGSDQQRQQTLLTLLPALPKVFSKGAELELSELTLVTPEGKTEGNLRIDFPKVENENPLQMLQQIKGHGQLTMPTVLVKNLLIESARQQLLRQPALAKALADQMQAQQQAANVPSSSETATPEPLPTQDKPELDIYKQAVAKAEKKLSSLLESGVLLKQDNQYMIEIQLENGQLSINNQPFNSSMLTF